MTLQSMTDLEDAIGIVVGRSTQASSRLAAIC
jgi:hypothetical protein